MSCARVSSVLRMSRPCHETSFALTMKLGAWYVAEVLG